MTQASAIPSQDLERLVKTLVTQACTAGEKALIRENGWKRGHSDNNIHASIDGAVSPEIESAKTKYPMSTDRFDALREKIQNDVFDYVLNYLYHKSHNGGMELFIQDSALAAGTGAILGFAVSLGTYSLANLDKGAQHTVFFFRSAATATVVGIATGAGLGFIENGVHWLVEHQGKSRMIRQMLKHKNPFLNSTHFPLALAGK